jgi:hypothetical protein
MFSAMFSASLRGFEPPAYRLGGGRSIQLSYSDSYKIYISFYLLPFPSGRVFSHFLRRQPLYPAELRKQI